MIETQRLPKQKLPHDFSHFKRLQMATSCNNSPVTGNVMIETKLYFVNEVSDFPPCNQSMLIVSNHTCSSFSFLLFNFEQSRFLSFLRAVILFSLFSFCHCFRLLPCTSASYALSQLFYFNAHILFSLLCAIYVSSWAVADSHFFSLAQWREYLCVHSDASDVVPNFFLIEDHLSASDARQERLRKDVILEGD